MSDIAVHTGNDLSEQMRYAEVVSTGSLLPQAYRGKPADILLAVGLGQAMGLSPAESLYRIDVIQGKPTAAAELIAANVRKAGHTLRVRVDEANVAATATIIRADDPGYEHTVTRDAAWASKMGLATKDNYKKQPATMLQWRAITAVARMACPEALYGVAYTSDEMGDAGPVARPTAPVSASDFAQSPPAEPVEYVEADPEPDAPEPKPMTKRTQGQLFALFGQKGIAEDQQLAGINYRVGGTYTSRADVTEDDARLVIDYLKSLDDAEATETEVQS